jgi:hypothetical protein
MKGQLYGVTIGDPLNAGRDCFTVDARRTTCLLVPRASRCEGGPARGVAIRINFGVRRWLHSQKSSFTLDRLCEAVVRHGSACRKRARFLLGYALKLGHWKHIEGEAQNQLSLTHTQGRAMPHNSWQSLNQETGFEAKDLAAPRVVTLESNEA